MLKHFTGSSAKSYMIKFALKMSFSLFEDNRKDLGFNIRRVLRHWTIKDKFSSVHPELRAMGITGVEVGDSGFIFHREDVDLSAKQKEVKEAEKEKERGNEAYRKRDFARAIVHYQRALDIDSENIIHWSNLTAVMFQIKAFREVCRLDRDIFSLNFFPLSVSGSATWRSSWERAIGRRQNFKTEPVVPGKNWSNLKKPLKRNPGEMTGEAVHVEDLHIVVVFLSVSRGASSKMLLDTTQEHWPMIQKMPKLCQTEQPVITNWSSWTSVLR